VQGAGLSRGAPSLQRKSIYVGQMVLGETSDIRGKAITRNDERSYKKEVFLQTFGRKKKGHKNCRGVQQEFKGNTDELEGFWAQSPDSLNSKGTTARRPETLFGRSLRGPKNPGGKLCSRG